MSAGDGEGVEALRHAGVHLCVQIIYAQPPARFLMSGYGQEDTPAGFISAYPTLVVKYGVPVPMYLSQPGYAGADMSDPMLTGAKRLRMGLILRRRIGWFRVLVFCTRACWCECSKSHAGYV